MEHVLFNESDVQCLGRLQEDLISYGGVAICKQCGAINNELNGTCVRRTAVVSWHGSDGTTRTGRLVLENTRTAIVKPHIWIHSDAIKIHKRKQRMVYTGRWI